MKGITNVLNSHSNLPIIIKSNPEANNNDIAAVVRINMRNVNWRVSSLYRKLQLLERGFDLAKVIYISPHSFGIFIVNIQRLFTGVKFAGEVSLIHDYVLGNLRYNTDRYIMAEEQTKQMIAQNRRLIISIMMSDPECITIDFEKDQNGMCTIC